MGFHFDSDLLWLQNTSTVSTLAFIVLVGFFSTYQVYTLIAFKKKPPYVAMLVLEESVLTAST